MIIHSQKALSKDSIHIECSDLDKLEKEFFKKYGRELRGKNLGQFHNDFPTIKDKKTGKNHQILNPKTNELEDEIPISIKSYFIMKKCYIDLIRDSTNEIDYVIRGKGLTQNSILGAGELKGGLMNLYKSLYEGNEEEFDLTYGEPKFNMNNNFTVETKKIFTRTTKTTYEEGIREKYFLY